MILMSIPFEMIRAEIWREAENHVPEIQAFIKRPDQFPDVHLLARSLALIVLSEIGLRRAEAEPRPKPESLN